MTDKMFLKIAFCAVGVALLSFTSECLERNVAHILNPGCPALFNCTSTMVLFYVHADGADDSLHYLWSFEERPTMVVALCPPETSINVLWPVSPTQAFVSNASITFTKSPTYFFGFVINRIFVYNDADNVGTFNSSNTNSSYVRDLPMPTNWNIVNIVPSKESVKLDMLGTWEDANDTISGKLELTLEAFGTRSHGDHLPHMLHSGNSSQLDMILREVDTPKEFSNPRFGLELVLTASEPVGKNMSISSYKSLDDENTPGVFTLTEIQTPASAEHNAGGFLQWRPVSYIADKRDITNSTEMAVYPVQNISSVLDVLNGTILGNFQQVDAKFFLTQSFVVSFGATDDGFYKKYNYSSWTLTMGYGSPPFERFSLLVILVIGACLGIPGLLIVGSGVYLCIRSLTGRKDDLLLTS